MSSRARALDYLGQKFVRCRAIWNLQRFLFFERGRHRLVEIGRAVEFNVPVRGGGRGTIRVGERCKFGFPASHRFGSGEIMLQARSSDAVITLGCDNYINNNSVLCAMESIRLGNKCLIGEQVAVYDCDFHEVDPVARSLGGTGQVKPVVIGDNVWIGSRALILKGVTIGDNSVIGAMSVVTKSVPNNCVAGGNPARVIRIFER